MTDENRGSGLADNVLFAVVIIAVVLFAAVAWYAWYDALLAWYAWWYDVLQG